MSWPITAISVATIVSLVAAAIHDVATRTIPDRIALAISMLGLVAHILHGTLAEGLLTGISLAAALTFLWSRGWIGGGDVKLAGSAAFATLDGQIANFVIATTLAGGTLAIIYLVLAGVLPHPSPGRRAGLIARCLKAEAWRIRRGGPLPYAVAIAVGGFYAARQSFAAG